jgi:hypothetical protein
MNTIINPEDYDEFVSLGRCCEISFVLAELELTTVSYPFDWATVKSITYLCTCLKDDFKQFSNFLKKNTPLVPTQNEYHSGNLDICFPHGASQLTQINNFRKLMKSDKKILFLIKNHINDNTTIKEAELLIQTLKSISSTITFEILIVNEYLDTYTGEYINNYPSECKLYNVIGTQFMTPECKSYNVIGTQFITPEYYFPYILQCDKFNTLWYKIIITKDSEDDF